MGENKLLRVLLVDDEPFVFEGLRIMVDWEKYGFSICGEASNGEDALEIIKTGNPHLVITDIRMPVMDGIQLIKSVYEDSNLRAKFIILSGYNDFDYAKKAMKYGVNSYILKPLDEDELNQAVKKAGNQIQEERKKEESRNNQLSFVAENAINSILKGNAKDSEIKRANFMLDIKEDEEIKMLLLEIDNFDKWMSDYDEVELRKIRDKTKELINSSMDDEINLKIFEDDLSRFCVVISQSMCIYSRINDYAKDLKKTIENALNCSVSIAISDSMSGIKSLEPLFKQVDLAISYKFFKDIGSVILYKNIKNMSKNYDFFEVDIDALKKCIKKNDVDGIKRTMKNLFHGFSKKLTAPEVIKIYIENLELECIKYVMELKGNVQEFTKKIIDFNKDLEKSTMKELKNEVCDLCIFLAQYIDSITKSNSKDIILEMQQYIKENYSKEINLKIIGKELYVNPVYIGRKFKKTTGMQFNEYLHKIRIEEAKKLLRKTNMKVSDVARSVGYNDTEYFTAKFKSFTNFSPSEFKNNFLVNLHKY
ncbi:response regulator [Herbivorax sp. ANBcel31]|uniref:response regulator transcription factor n=1 Tax=Herbivorax sp. ANBcel31 TaxID=3069754 RepID=UPI0027B54D6F|nr:response regulator [Herbivorax sp. ANBcel31]MDQ2084872.1 response regulator [Herbivorax sp. ANBcel31]